MAPPTPLKRRRLPIPAGRRGFQRRYDRLRRRVLSSQRPPPENPLHGLRYDPALNDFTRQLAAILKAPITLPPAVKIKIKPQRASYVR